MSDDPRETETFSERIIPEDIMYLEIDGTKSIFDFCAEESDLLLVFMDDSWMKFDVKTSQSIYGCTEEDYYTVFQRMWNDTPEMLGECVGKLKHHAPFITEVRREARKIDGKITMVNCGIVEEK